MKSNEGIQREAPADAETHAQGDLEILELRGAIYQQKYKDKEHPLMPENRWDL
jgi:hypothetical protein